MTIQVRDACPLNFPHLTPPDNEVRTALQVYIGHTSLVPNLQVLQPPLDEQPEVTLITQVGEKVWEVVMYGNRSALQGHA